MAVSAAIATMFPIAPAQAAEISQMSLEQLLEVTIVGASKYEQKQEDVAAAVSIITRDEIQAYGWRTLADALNSLPGLYMTYDRQYSYLGARGFGLPGDYTTRVLLTINGNRVNDVVYDSAVTGRSFPLDLDLVERIEYIPGPGGAVYGQNALFGVVNVVTRNGSGLGGAEIAVSYQAPQATRVGRASWGRLLDNGIDALVSVTTLKSGGEDHSLNFPGASDPDYYPWLSSESGVVRNMDGERDNEFFGRLARGPWSFDIAYGDRDKEDPTAAFFTEPFVTGQSQADRYLLTQFQYQSDLSDTLQLSGRVFLGRYRYDAHLSYGSPYRYQGMSDWQGAEARLLATGIDNHKLLIGVEYQDNSRRDQTEENLTVPEENILIPGSGYRAGIYIQDEWQISPELTATLGLRFDRNDVTGGAWSPRAGLIWKVRPETTLKALYGRAHRAPNAYERDYGDNYTQSPNPDLDGETIDTYELVAEHVYPSNLRLRGSLYIWQMQGLVTLDDDPDNEGLTKYFSGEDVEATGLELSADKTWGWGGRLRGSLSYQDIAYKSGAELLNAPQWLGKLNFSGPIASTGLRLGYEMQYSSERLSLDGSDLDGYLLSNLVLTANGWAKGLGVSLGVYNLFNTGYEHPGSDTNWQNALRQDGRSVRLKLSYAF